MAVSAVIAGGIGAAGSIGSALIGSSAAKSASAQQTQLGYSALANQQKMFQVSQDALNPFVQAGQSALPTQKALLTPGSNQTAALSQLPGFQFSSEYGTKAATNALAASGKASGGPLATAVSNYNQGLAGTQFGNFVNQIQAFINSGVTAGGALSGAAQGFSGQNTSTLTGIGAAQAAGTLGSANALSSGVQGGANSLTNALILGNIAGSNGGLYGGPGTVSGKLADRGFMPGNVAGTGGYNFIDAQAPPLTG